MSDSVAEKRKVPFARIAWEYPSEAFGYFLDRGDVFLFSGSQTECGRLIIDVNIKRNEEVSRIGVLPYSQIHFSIVPYHPSPHHVDLLVGCLEIGLLPEDLSSELVL